ncbi:Hypothetical_protein [Hexamita inflata]|uniref:Hypothetical_protein n=2 Tax=Hexamita inflata TaxID=28002 RepID=A0AA86QES0_9EUKA|nr:Hypothetical protein HINF_LOCUS43151 [Hexamita inflata]
MPFFMHSLQLAGNTVFTFRSLKRKRVQRLQRQIFIKTCRLQINNRALDQSWLNGDLGSQYKTLLHSQFSAMLYAACRTVYDVLDQISLQCSFGEYTAIFLHGYSSKHKQSNAPQLELI